MRSTRGTVLALTALVALAGCGDDAGSGSLETTDRSLAAVTIAEIGLPVEFATHAHLKGDKADHGAKVRFAAAAGDSTLEPNLDTLVLPASSAYVDQWCERGPDDGCVVDTLDDGRDILLRWQLEEPEEDPGIVEIAVVGDDGIVKLGYDGDPVTGDPREPGVMPEGLGIDELFELAASPRLGPRASAADHDAGEDLETWVDEEPDTSSF
jgi:hypothetical protein